MVPDAVSQSVLSVTTAPLERLRAALGNRYRVERVIGTGGMASVFLAEDLKHRRRVAIKVLRPELAAALGADRFLQEIQLTANLQHPHILPLFDSGESEGLLFYVMPYVEGETLRGRLDREQRLPVGDAVRLAGEIAAALDYAHRQGVVHRDIKPENILLHDGAALVADFGIALAADSAEDRLTATGISLGTPWYMSPEQALGQSDVDLRCDIYALGATLYEMLTGRPPFTGPNAQAIVAQVITETPLPPDRIRPEVPASVSDAVLVALRKDPAARFPSAAAFQSALDRPAPAAGTVPMATRARAATRRPSPRTTLVAALGAAVLLAAIAFNRARRRALDPAGAAPPSSAAAPRRIAVIPFRNASGDTGNTSFSEGLSLEINDALSRLPELTVVVASSARYRAAGVDVGAAGRELGVDAVLTGLVDTADSLVRVRVQLEDVRTHALRWSAKYDRARKDLYMLEDTLSLAIARDLRLATAPGADRAARARRTANPEAHTLLVQARGNAETRTQAGLATAISLFTAAIALDSTYAEAWAGRATAENLAATYGYAAPAALYPVAKADAHRALAIDSSVAAAHTTLGFLAVFRDWDWATAAAEFSRSVALDSTAASTRLYRAWYYVAVDQMDSAVASARTAVRLEPAAPIYDTRLGTILYLAGDLKAAEAALLGALGKDPGYTLAHRQLAEVYASQGRCGEALSEVRRAPELPDESGDLARAAALCGDTAMARMWVADRAARAAAGQPLDMFWAATVSSALNDRAGALRWLEAAARQHAGLIFMVRRHPAFESYRDHPRFKAVMRSVYGV
jgi:serine/threonine-protein kinase